jgi:hypothetical protein
MPCHTRPRTGPDPGTLAAHVPADDDVEAGHAVAAALLDSILAGRETGTWDPAKGAWR